MDDLTEKYQLLSKRHAAQGRLLNPNYLFLRDEIESGKYRYFILQGGQRSGKTVAAIQTMWCLMHEFTGMKFSIVRKTMPTLKATVLQDFIKWGQDAKLYNESQHNKTEGWYKDENGNMVDFISAEDEEKLRGRERDVLYVNEACELPWEIVEQLRGRTNGIIIMDYNPSYPESWMYDRILTRKDCAFIKTTYKDNPHLTPGILSELEDMRLNDADRYRIYGMGERGEIRGQIYSNWTEVENKFFPKDANIFVIDFGYSSDPAAIIQAKIEEKTLWVDEKVYRPGLNNIDLAICLFFEGATDKCWIIADSAEPKSIGELRNGWELTENDIAQRTADLGYEFESKDQFKRLQKRLKDGWVIHGAQKGQDSVRTGIQKVQQYKVLATQSSKNLWKEYAKYKWKEDEVTGKLLKVPDKRCADHILDCVRYTCLSHGRLY